MITFPNPLDFGAIPIEKLEEIITSEKQTTVFGLIIWLDCTYRDFEIDITSAHSYILQGADRGVPTKKYRLGIVKNTNIETRTHTVTLTSRRLNATNADGSGFSSVFRTKKERDDYLKFAINYRTILA